MREGDPLRRFAGLTNRGGLLRASLIVFIGFSLARLLGFLFTVASGRLLTSIEFGRLTYAMTVTAILAALLSSSPVGLARFLSLHREEQALRRSYYVNWALVVGTLLLISLALTPFLGAALGLGGWMVAAVAVNLVGVAVLEGYRELQRGSDRYVAMASFYVLANALQLLMILVLGWIGVREAPLYLFVYGISSILALIVLEAGWPVGLQIDRRLISRARCREIAVFISPLLAQSVFFVVWYGVDMLLVQNLLGAVAAGDYAAAKTLGLALTMPTIAVATALMPRVARIARDGLARYTVTVMGVSALVVLPLTAVGVFLSKPIIEVTFGRRHLPAAEALPIIAVGMALYGFQHVLASLWVGRGRPAVGLYSTAGGMVVSVALALFLVRPFGLLGAAIAFTAGSAVRTGITTVYTLWHLGRPAEDLDPAAAPAGAAEAGPRQ